MSAFQGEFERRVKAVLAPDHLGHDTSALTVQYEGTEGSGCETCGYDASAEIRVTGECGCGAKVWKDKSLASDDFGIFMQKITADDL